MIPKLQAPLYTTFPGHGGYPLALPTNISVPTTGQAESATHHHTKITTHP